MSDNSKNRKSLYTLKEMPVNNRPRERLIELGPQALNDFELLAIILRTGSKDYSVLDLAKQVIFSLDNLGKFNSITLEELTNFPGISNAKAAEVLASIEFGKRGISYKEKRFKVSCANDIYEFVRYDMENNETEEFRILGLNIKSEITSQTSFNNGSIHKVTVDYHDILKWALRHSSNHIVVCHNHPSGDPTPSKEDILFTRNLMEKANSFAISIVDHVIIGKNKYYSFLENRSK